MKKIPMHLALMPLLAATGCRCHRESATSESIQSFSIADSSLVSHVGSARFGLGSAADSLAVSLAFHVDSEEIIVPDGRVARLRGVTLQGSHHEVISAASLSAVIEDSVNIAAVSHTDSLSIERNESRVTDTRAPASRLRWLVVGALLAVASFALGRYLGKAERRKNG